MNKIQNISCWPIVNEIILEQPELLRNCLNIFIFDGGQRAILVKEDKNLVKLILWLAGFRQLLVPNKKTRSMCIELEDLCFPVKIRHILFENGWLFIITVNEQVFCRDINNYDFTSENYGQQIKPVNYPFQSIDSNKLSELNLLTKTKSTTNIDLSSFVCDNVRKICHNNAHTLLLNCTNTSLLVFHWKMGKLLDFYQLKPPETNVLFFDVCLFQEIWVLLTNEHTLVMPVTSEEKHFLTIDLMKTKVDRLRPDTKFKRIYSTSQQLLLLTLVGEIYFLNIVSSVDGGQNSKTIFYKTVVKVINASERFEEIYSHYSCEDFIAITSTNDIWVYSKQFSLNKTSKQSIDCNFIRISLNSLPDVYSLYVRLGESPILTTFPAEQIRTVYNQMTLNSSFNADLCLQLPNNYRLFVHKSILNKRDEFFPRYRIRQIQENKDSSRYFYEYSTLIEDRSLSSNLKRYSFDLIFQYLQYIYGIFISQNTRFDYIYQNHMPESFRYFLKEIESLDQFCFDGIMQNANLQAHYSSPIQFSNPFFVSQVESTIQTKSPMFERTSLTNFMTKFIKSKSKMFTWSGTIKTKPQYAQQNQLSLAKQPRPYAQPTPITSNRIYQQQTKPIVFQFPKKRGKSFKISSSFCEKSSFTSDDEQMYINNISYWPILNEIIDAYPDMLQNKSIGNDSITNKVLICEQGNLAIIYQKIKQGNSTTNRLIVWRLSPLVTLNVNRNVMYSFHVIYEDNETPIVHLSYNCGILYFINQAKRINSLQLFRLNTDIHPYKYIDNNDINPIFLNSPQISLLNLNALKVVSNRNTTLIIVENQTTLEKSIIIWRWKEWGKLDDPRLTENLFLLTESSFLRKYSDNEDCFIDIICSSEAYLILTKKNRLFVQGKLCPDYNCAAIEILEIKNFFPLQNLTKMFMSKTRLLFVDEQGDIYGVRIDKMLDNLKKFIKFGPLNETDFKCINIYANYENERFIVLTQWKQENRCFVFVPNITENNIEVDDKFQRLIEITFYSTIPESCAIFLSGEVPILCALSTETFQQFQNKTMNDFNNPINPANTLHLKVNDEHRYFVDPKYFVSSLRDNFGTIFKNILPNIFDSYLRYCYTNEFWIDEGFLDRLDSFLEVIKPIDQTVYKIKNYINQISPSNQTKNPIRLIMIEDSLEELMATESPVHTSPIVSETSTSANPVITDILASKQYPQYIVKEDETKFKEQKVKMKNQIEAKNQLQVKSPIEEKTFSEDIQKSIKIPSTIKRSSRRKRIGSRKYRGPRSKSKKSKKKYRKKIRQRKELAGSSIEMSSEMSRSKKSETGQKSPRKSKGIKMKPKYRKENAIKLDSSLGILSQDLTIKTFEQKISLSNEERKDPLYLIDDFSLLPIIKDILINEPNLLKNYQKLYTCDNGHILIIQNLDEKNCLNYIVWFASFFYHRSPLPQWESLDYLNSKDIKWICYDNSWLFTIDQNSEFECRNIFVPGFKTVKPSDQWNEFQRKKQLFPFGSINWHIDWKNIKKCSASTSYTALLSHAGELFVWQRPVRSTDELTINNFNAHMENKLSGDAKNTTAEASSKISVVDVACFQNGFAILTKLNVYFFGTISPRLIYHSQNIRDHYESDYGIFEIHNLNQSIDGDFTAIFATKNRLLLLTSAGRICFLQVDYFHDQQSCEYKLPKFFGPKKIWANHHDSTLKIVNVFTSYYTTEFFLTTIANNNDNQKRIFVFVSKISKKSGFEMPDCCLLEIHYAFYPDLNALWLNGNYTMLTILPINFTLNSIYKRCQKFNDPTENSKIVSIHNRFYYINPKYFDTTNQKLIKLLNKYPIIFAHSYLFYKHCGIFVIDNSFYDLLKLFLKEILNHDALFVKNVENIRIHPYKSNSYLMLNPKH